MAEYGCHWRTSGESDICLDYIETKTDPDIDIGIFFTFIMLVTVAISGFDQEWNIFIYINVVNGILCRVVACLENITNIAPSVVCWDKLWDFVKYYHYDIAATPQTYVDKIGENLIKFSSSLICKMTPSLQLGPGWR